MVVALAGAVASCGGSVGPRDSAGRGSEGGVGSLDSGAMGTRFADADVGDGFDEVNPAVADPSQGCSGDGIIPDATGFVAADTNASGINGAWSIYTDCDDYGPLEGGIPVPGKDCSVVSSPAPGTPFMPQPGGAAMCWTGSTVQVFSEAEWPLRWGAYMALDLHDVGGVAQDFNGAAASIRGFCFYISGYTIPVFRVRFPTDQGIRTATGTRRRSTTRAGTKSSSPTWLRSTRRARRSIQPSSCRSSSRSRRR